MKEEETARLEAEHKEMTDRNRQLAKNERLSKHAQMDVKSVESSSKVKVQKSIPKPFESGTARQAIVTQTADGSLKIDEKAPDLEELHAEYADALRGVRRKRKAYEKARASMKHLKTPVLS